MNGEIAITVIATGFPVGTTAISSPGNKCWCWRGRRGYFIELSSCVSCKITSESPWYWSNACRAVPIEHLQSRHSLALKMLFSLLISFLTLLFLFCSFSSSPSSSSPYSFYLISVFRLFSIPIFFSSLFFLVLVTVVRQELYEGPWTHYDHWASTSSCFYRAGQRCWSCHHGRLLPILPSLCRTTHFDSTTHFITSWHIVWYHVTSWHPSLFRIPTMRFIA